MFEGFIFILTYFFRRIILGWQAQNFQVGFLFVVIQDLQMSQFFEVSGRQCRRSVSRCSMVVSFAGARFREVLDRRRLGQAGFVILVWKCYIYQAVEVRYFRDSSIVGLYRARNLFFLEGRYEKFRVSVFQIVDGQIKKSFIISCFFDFGIIFFSEVSSIKLGRFLNCDSGWKWDREKIYRDLV